MDCEAVRLQAFNSKYRALQKCLRALTLTRQQLSFVLPGGERHAQNLEFARNAADDILYPDPCGERMRLNGLSAKTREEVLAVELATQLSVYSVVDGVQRWEFDEEFLREFARRLIAYGRTVPEQPK